MVILLLFYGLEAFTDALAELLPEAESRTIYQLLDNNAGDELGNLYRDTARRYLVCFLYNGCNSCCRSFAFCYHACINCFTDILSWTAR